MRFTVSTTELTQKLQPPAHIASTRSGLAAIGGVLVRVESGAIQLLATDLEMSICVPVDGAQAEDGTALVPARLLLDVVRMAPGGEVTCSTDGASETLEVVSKSSSVKLRMLRAEDFPNIPTHVAGDSVELPGAVLSTAIGQVGRAASRDETRPLLTGILISAQGDQLRLVATDSYRLAVREVALEAALPTGFEVTVPARALNEVARLSQQLEHPAVGVTIDNNQISFKVGDVVLSSRLLEGHFPDYRQLLPESAEHELQFATDELLDVVRRVSLVAQKNTPLSLALRAGEMTVAARTPDVGEASETIPAEFSGEGFEVGFNPTYLRDGLESADSARLTLKLVSPLRPGVIEADGVEDGRFLYLVMPVRLGV